MNVVDELVCLWFDGCYNAKARTQASLAFSVQEIVALENFHQIFDAVADFLYPCEVTPSLEPFIQTPQWKQMSDAAAVALEAFQKPINETRAD